MWGLRAARSAALAFRQPARLAAVRWATHEKQDVGAVRKGMILLLQNQYVEVKEWSPSKSGRAAQSFSLTFEELDTGKERTQKFGGNTKMTQVTPDRMECQVMYLTGGGKEERKVVLADEDYNEVELPLSWFYSNPNVAEGSKVLMYKDEEAIVKISVLGK
mmetsp:Transcript_96228/g.310697  ORF Transcript_96228/g.310697 Transcript_96228/m.310697 type:complete len:161 (+) Transcript_96228:71-553(+)